MKKTRETQAETNEKQDLVTALFWNNSVELLRMAQPLINKYVIDKLRKRNQEKCEEDE